MQTRRGMHISTEIWYKDVDHKNSKGEHRSTSGVADGNDEGKAIRPGHARTTRHNRAGQKADSGGMIQQTCKDKRLRPRRRVHGAHTPIRDPRPRARARQEPSRASARRACSAAARPYAEVEGGTGDGANMASGKDALW
jgi:hypothetical protein